MHAKGLLLLSWVSMLEPYPVISNVPQGALDLIKLKELNSYRHYNAYYIPIASTKSSKNHQISYVPCIVGQNPLFDEFYVLNKSQILTQFCVEFGPSLIRDLTAPVISDEAIIKACKEGNLPLLQDWICENPSKINIRSHNNESLLYFAALGGQLEIVEWLRSQSPALLDRTTSFGATPLYAAILGGYLTTADWYFLNACIKLIR